MRQKRPRAEHSGAERVQRATTSVSSSISSLLFLVPAPLFVATVESTILLLELASVFAVRSARALVLPATATRSFPLGELIGVRYARTAPSRTRAFQCLSTAVTLFAARGAEPTSPPPPSSSSSSSSPPSPPPLSLPLSSSLSICGIQ